MPEDGTLIANADEQFSRALAHTHTGKVVLYGIKENKKLFDTRLPAGQVSNNFWSAENIAYGEMSSFDLTQNGKHIIALKTCLLGKHNIQNIVGVSAMLLERQLLTPEELALGVKTFKGVKRRIELLSKNSDVQVYEGFGSSYEKARAAFDAIKLHFPKKRMVTVFEPHTFSWRNRDALSWYDDVFRDSDLVLIYEPATQGAGSHKQLTQDEIVMRVQASGIETYPIHSEEEGLALLEKRLTADDVVLLMTSGDLGGLIKSVPGFVAKKFQKKA